MWRHVLHGTLLPFVIGAAIGAAAGAKAFVSLPLASLQAILGAFILLVTWLPKLGRVGGERNRFAFLGLARPSSGCS